MGTWYETAVYCEETYGTQVNAANPCTALTFPTTVGKIVLFVALSFLRRGFNENLVF